MECAFFSEHFENIIVIKNLLFTEIIFKNSFYNKVYDLLFTKCYIIPERRERRERQSPHHVSTYLSFYLNHVVFVTYLFIAISQLRFHLFLQ